MMLGPLARYKQDLAEGEIIADDAQNKIILQ